MILCSRGAVFTQLKGRNRSVAFGPRPAVDRRLHSSPNSREVMLPQYLDAQPTQTRPLLLGALWYVMSCPAIRTVEQATLCFG